MKREKKNLSSRKSFLGSKPVSLTGTLFKEGQGDGEGILVNLKSGVYYTMNHSAQRIWQFMDGKVPVGEVAERIAKSYDIAPSRAFRDVVKCIRRLHEAGLIKIK